MARFGGDEFVVVLEELMDSTDVVQPLTSVLSRFTQPFEVDGRLGSFVNAMVNGVAAGEEAAGDRDGVADVQRADGRFVNGGV